MQDLGGENPGVENLAAILPDVAAVDASAGQVDEYIAAVQLADP